MYAHPRLRRGLVALAIAAGVVAAPTAASAHNGLVGTDPEGGSSNDDVTEVVIEFAEEVLDIGASITVTDADGVDHAVGEPEVRRKRFIAQPVGELAGGKYTVKWRVVGEDGHPVDGKYSFVVTPAEPSPAPSEAAPSPSPSGAPAPPAPNLPAGSESGPSAGDSGGFPDLGWRGILVPVAIGAVLVARLVLPRLRK